MTSPADFDRPSIARVFDALVGGHEHREADREVLRQILELAPEALVMARELRHWLKRAVRFLADQVGIEQFIDLGSGFPTSENTHTIAHRYSPHAQVVYVDNDPVVQERGRQLLGENDFTHIAGNDLTRPQETLDDPGVTAHIDLRRPVGLILCAIIHHIEDLAQAQEIVRTYVDALAPGSYLVLAHQFNPGDGSESSDVAQSLQDRFTGTGLDTLYRTRAEIASFFAGLELVEPGLVYPHEWWPDGPRFMPLSPCNFTTLAGVGRKP
ncbi:S-adenosyl methyltransferase [Amycolatopsis xylanica]|uniref:S-adenosyl methyltransferase n=1 Tax=Amycolatopsis xylanica TaxID=589385 RepID=A0A1H2ZZN6_9PSEU|nr:S-adenosyl methyltransferase [Amycolatopsis xylanica]